MFGLPEVSHDDGIQCALPARVAVLLTLALCPLRQAVGTTPVHDFKPATNLFLSLADRMHFVGQESFGDSTGRLANV